MISSCETGLYYVMLLLLGRGLQRRLSEGEKRPGETQGQAPGDGEKVQEDPQPTSHAEGQGIPDIYEGFEIKAPST